METNLDSVNIIVKEAL